MNCDQFQSRMDSLLDSRHDITQDESLGQHSESCPMCEERLRVWGKISDVIAVEAVAKTSPDRIRLPVFMTALKTPQLAGVVAIAAAILVFVSIGDWSRPLTSPENQQVALLTDGNAAPPHPSDSDANEEILLAAAPQARMPWQSDGWWTTTMPDEQWVHNTMPGVISVGQGVAPIGRSMKQAFAILMIQRRPANSDRSPVSPTVQPEPFSEQTSNGIPPHLLATWT